ncbi:hypothetical protein EV650_3041 [Kribbella kalugense]|uniref:Uncharacterized protein n=1 Tax=Kribbella kalugense TaxID=2512221 RepID=A0A4R8A1V2_9ACTN|nr:hypothetical protein EV650_3041 [Kribbella kalugense]
MDRGPDGETDARPDELSPPRWSIRRAIELLDEGIDRMGEQLTRSAGLWGDSPAEPDEPTDPGGPELP